MKVKDLCDLWIDEKKFEVKETTLTTYTRIIKKHLAYFYDYDIQDINTQIITDFINFKLSKHDATYVKNIVIVLNSLLYYAYNKGFTEQFFKAKKPRLTTNKEIETFTSDEVKRLEKFLIENLSWKNICLLLDLFCGIRIGELCGIKYKDIDFQNGTISIKRNVQRVINYDPNAKSKTMVIITTPKSKTSVRLVTVPAFLLQIIKQRKLRADDFLISGSHKIIEPRNYSRHYKKVLKDCNIAHKRFNSIRHTFATTSIQNVDIKTLSELLGHADAKVTLNTYVHSNLKLKQDHATAINQEFIARHKMEEMS